MSDDLISRSELKAEILQELDRADLTDYEPSAVICEIYDRCIDNAPTVSIKPFAVVKFDKDELNRIVDERVIEPIKNGELVIKEERPKCEWLTTGEEQGALGIIYKIRKCSKCGWEHSLVIPDNYCPNCGAEKRKEAENE